MKAFDKNNWDVSKTFLAYLTFLGNTTKVGIALDMQPEVVEVLAAAEDWPAKLKVYLALRQEQRLPQPDASFRRTATYIAACQLREIIQRLTAQVYQRVDDEGIMAFFSPRDPRTNRPRFEPRILIALCRAFSVVTRIICREIPQSADDPEEPKVKERVTIRRALATASDAMDVLPGIDSVALARDSLAKWNAAREQPDENLYNDYVI